VGNQEKEEGASLEMRRESYGGTEGEYSRGFGAGEKVKA